MKQVILSCILLWVVTGLMGQSDNGLVSLKTFTPPSPDAAALAKYGEIPVSLSTGLPEISIPLYEIRSKQLRLPISLSYHASGNKIEDIAPVAGLGWVLNAGGVITRNVISQPDESVNGILNRTFYYKNRSYFIDKTYSSPDLFYLTNLSSNQWDTQSDQYTINSPAFSGSFIFDTSGVIHHTPVDKQLLISGGARSGWTIKDDNGNSYFFSGVEATHNYAAARLDTTAWYLTRIVSADKTDTISFNYTAADSVREYNETQLFTVNIDDDCGMSPNPVANYSSTVHRLDHYRLVLSSIVFSVGEVQFTYASDRQDPGKERLTSVKILSQGQLRKQFDLKQGYFSTTADVNIETKYGKRLRLDTVIIKGSNLTDEGQYSFEYNSSALPAYHVIGENARSRNGAMDLWGYYNGGGITSMETHSLIPNHLNDALRSYMTSMSLSPNYWDVLFAQHSGDRLVNPLYTQAGILQTIIYPTGGVTHFEFENNRGNLAIKGNDYTGGLRVKRIASYAGANAVPVIKTYQYNDSLGTGITIAHNAPETYSYENKTFKAHPSTYCGFCPQKDFTIATNSTNAINYYQGASVIYPKVTEYLGYPAANEGKTEYFFDTETDSSYSHPDLTKYWNFGVDKSWARGMPLNTKVFRNDNGQYTLLKQTQHTYQKMGVKTVRAGYLCELLSAIEGTNMETFLICVAAVPTTGKLLTHYEYFDIDVPMGVKKLVKTEETDYGSPSLTQTTEYLYESGAHLYPTKTKTYTSIAQDTLITVLRYPEDKSYITGLGSTASAAIDSLINHNRLDAPVETLNYNNATLLTKLRTDYKSWASAKIYPEYMLQQVKNNSLEQRVQYKSYDAGGNPVTMGYINNNDISYIWDNNNSLLVAEAKNAGAADIAFTSFEEGAAGGWTFGSNHSATYKLTGEKSYNLSGGNNVTKTGLNSGKTYTVSYWSQSSSATVNSGSGTAKLTKDGWTLYEHGFSGNTSVSVSGSVYIDELRLHPSNAEMVSYVHKPLTGIIATGDVNHQLSFYYYDVFNRLLTVRDMDKKIIRQFDYAYSPNKVTNWSPPGQNMAPNWVATSATRCVKDGYNYNTGEEEAEYQDQNIYSTSYGFKKWVSLGVTGQCPMPCASPACTGNDKKCINSICETGIKIYTDSYYDAMTGLWQCTYHYEWSDASWSTNYYETWTTVCPTDE